MAVKFGVKRKKKKALVKTLQKLQVQRKVVIDFVSNPCIVASYSKIKDNNIL